MIDFIDMEENRNNKAVERKLNECLKNDRARIQVGRISHFGLLEMSRQRIRTGVLESSTIPCPHCAGTGLLRSTPSLALHVLRALEDQLLRAATHDITLRTRLETAFYILNQKRESLTALEARFGVTVTVVAEVALAPGQHFVIERGEPVQPRMMAERIEGEALAESVSHRPTERSAPRAGASARAIHPEDIEMDDVEEEETTEEEDAEEASEDRTETGSEGSEERKKRRRRRRRGGRNGEAREPREPGAPRIEGAEPAEGSTEDEDDGSDEEDGAEARDGQPGSPDQAGDAERKRRRRRRGGRRNRRDRDGREVPAGENQTGEFQMQEGEGAEAMNAPTTAAEPVADAAPAEAGPTEAEAPAKKPRRGRTAKVAAETETVVVEVKPVAEAQEKPVDEKPAKPTRSRAKKAPATEAAAEPVAMAPVVEMKVPEIKAPEVKAPEIKTAPKPVAPAPEPEVEDPNRPKRSGWWAKAKQALSGT